jgi:hypothetical protein
MATTHTLRGTALAGNSQSSHNGRESVQGVRVCVLVSGHAPEEVVDGVTEAGLDRGELGLAPDGWPERARGAFLSVGRGVFVSWGGAAVLLTRAHGRTQTSRAAEELVDQRRRATGGGRVHGVEIRRHQQREVAVGVACVDGPDLLLELLHLAERRVRRGLALSIQRHGGVGACDGRATLVVLVARMCAETGAGCPSQRLYSPTASSSWPVALCLNSASTAPLRLSFMLPPRLPLTAQGRLKSQ